MWVQSLFVYSIVTDPTFRPMLSAPVALSWLMDAGYPSVAMHLSVSLTPPLAMDLQLFDISRALRLMQV